MVSLARSDKVTEMQVRVNRLGRLVATARSAIAEPALDQLLEIVRTPPTKDWEALHNAIGILVDSKARNDVLLAILRNWLFDSRMTDFAGGAIYPLTQLGSAGFDLLCQFAADGTRSVYLRVSAIQSAAASAEHLPRLVEIGEAICRERGPRAQYQADRARNSSGSRESEFSYYGVQWMFQQAVKVGVPGVVDVLCGLVEDSLIPIEERAGFLGAIPEQSRESHQWNDSQLLAALESTKINDCSRLITLMPVAHLYRNVRWRKLFLAALLDLCIHNWPEGEKFFDILPSGIWNSLEGRDMLFVLATKEHASSKVREFAIRTCDRSRWTEAGLAFERQVVRGEVYTTQEIQHEVFARWGRLWAGGDQTGRAEMLAFLRECHCDCTTYWALCAVPEARLQGDEELHAALVAIAQAAEMRRGPTDKAVELLSKSGLTDADLMRLLS